MKKILILGGTSFLGRNLITSLSESKSYKITIFNRGKTNPTLFPNIHKIIGDRDSDDIQKLKDTFWDCVIDFSCYFPHQLESVLAATNNNVGRYLFISTCSVYDNGKCTSILRQEDSAIHSCTASQKTEALPNSYGNKKAECERILATSGIDYLIFRPAIVYGKYDPTDRLYYWLYQVHQNDPILLPDNGKRLFSCTYVNDLVKVILEGISIKKHRNIYTLTSTPQISIRKIVDCTAQILGKSPNYVNASPAFLNSREIGQWVDMPLWLDADYYTYSNEKLIEDFDFQPIDFQESIKETIDYYKTLNWTEPTYGIKEKTRQKLLNTLSNS